ncbi:MAG TPA: PEGA domain-containing protein [Longimicrobiales bacterium]
MQMKIACILAALIVLPVAGCGDDDESFGPGENTRLEITSDPSGANIELDGLTTGRTTPTTIFDIGGRHDVVVRLDRDGISYGYRTEIDVRGDSLHRVTGPLMFRCSNTTCLLGAARNRDFGRLRISTQANGALFMKSGQGEGLLWPLGTSNSHASMGMPMIAMLSGTRDTLALGIYDTHYLAGRPEPVLQTNAERTTLRQSTWIVPPTNVITSNAPTVRGIEVEEELIGSPDSEIVFLRLTFRNITDRETYRAADPVVPSGGLRFDNVYVGFALDPDIGASGDDMITYEPGLDLVYAYDYNFFEEIFNSAQTAAPGMVGLKIVEMPAGATSKALNGWPGEFGVGSGDWAAGENTERGGYSMISGLRSLPPDYAGQLIGHTPTMPNDFRISVGAGPITLGPGQSTTITVAIIVAAPVETEYTPGQPVAPGDPSVADRQITRVAATLLNRARNLTIP